MRGGNNGNSNNSSLSESSNMEPSFYEDNNAQFSPGSIMKRPASLDLNSKNQAKKQRLTQTLPTPGPLVLESPDILACKLTTPELEKILLSSNLPTPTPTLVFPTKVHDCVHVGSEGGDYLRPVQQVTSEQEDYAKGFVDALNDLRNSENTKTQQNLSASAVVTANGMSGGSITYTNLDESFPVAIKDEPQTVPNSPPLSPIDMETQERIKLERKRQRNRVAASKCRKRKLERISKLEEKVKILKGENADLASVIKQLKEHVFQLKQQVIDHLQAGCDISVYNSSTVLQVSNFN